MYTSMRAGLCAHGPRYRSARCQNHPGRWCPPALDTRGCADFPADTHIDADIVLVPGGDWPEMGRTHTAMAGLRAIENGYALVRQDFNGQSGSYDATGRPLSTKDTTTDSGIWYADVPTHGSPTPYSRTGDIVAWGVLAGTLAAATAIATRSRRRPAPPSPAASAARASGVGPGR
ncbi:carbon-nitrogen hydrolase family protein [Streptomyces malaysiensis]|nr:hypothetical protein [Streptomyces malaysiensis]